jgi:LysM repeat protein
MKLRTTMLALVMLLLSGLAQAQTQTYVVQPGDNLTKIAQIYGVTPQTIVIANGLSNTNLVPGQILTIPVNNIYITATPVPPRPETVVVQPGDTLQRIAARYNTTWYALAVYNNIVNPNVIYAGTVLRIPPASFNPDPGQGGGVTPIVGITYIVQYGDSLTTIANRYGTTVQAIQAANGFTSTVITPGQVLFVPTVATPVPTPVPVVPTAVPPVVVPVQPITPSRPPALVGGRYYVVRPGDTLIRIAAYFGKSPWAIAQANGIYNLNRIYAGQYLLIP